MSPPPDLRLLPCAVASWAVVLVALLSGWVAAGSVAAVAVLVVLVVLRRGGRWAAGLAAAGACAAAVGSVAALQVAAATDNPLIAPAASGSAATVRVQLTSDADPVVEAGYGGRAGGAQRVVVHADLRWARVAGRAWRAGGRLVLLAPVPGWAGLLPGQQVTAEGLLAPAGRGDLTVALLRVRGPPGQVGPAPWWQRAAGSLRDGLRRAAGVLDGEPAALLPGLVVGDTSGLGPVLRADFRTAGLSHLVAVSGQNVC